MFIELLPGAAGRRRRGSIRTSARPAPDEHSQQGQPATGLTPELSKKNVFEDIALAHREIYALYEIAQALGTSLGVSDTMALISAKLSNLVPFSCAALFLYDEESDTLRCRFATGIDADIIQQVTVHSGEGLTGWVARNRRPLVNARPSADLEAAGLHFTTTLQSALVCPLMFSERFIGTLSVYHTDAAERVALRAMAVLIPPWCTQVTRTGCRGQQHLLTQRLGEPAHGELRGVVRALARNGDAGRTGWRC